VSTLEHAKRVALVTAEQPRYVPDTTLVRYAQAEQHRAPLRGPFHQPAFDPRVRVTLYRDGTVEQVIEGDVERVRRAIARAKARKA